MRTEGHAKRQKLGARDGAVGGYGRSRAARPQGDYRLQVVQAAEATAPEGWQALAHKVGDLEDFLRRSESPVTLAGQLDSFLRVPDSVIVITQNVGLLHRLDAAFFRVGETRGGLLAKFYAGEECFEDELLADFEKYWTSPSEA